MRCLVVCCDGTWNTPEQPSVTNVHRLYNALDTRDSGGNRQLAYYQPGVGTRGGLLGWLPGGIAGVGLSADVLDAYRWLTTTYEPGDRIALFGFSRGAYTARSLAGMISVCGLLDTRGRNAATIRYQIERVYDRRYRAADRPDPLWRTGLEFHYDPADAARIPVRFIGVWDTVGSLGIPDHLGILNLWDPPRRHAFHDVKLNPHIRYARHAVAMDEHRGPFAPTLWEDGGQEPGQDLQQVWFPGSHKDVGGGHPETGLSDGALRWMVEEAQKAGIAFDEDMLRQITPDETDVLHEDARTGFRLLAQLYDPAIGPLLQPFFEPRPRAVPRVDADRRDGAVHRSVYGRQQAKIITSRPYRPTRGLGAGGSPVTVTVSARRPWNDTGLYLDPGAYRFTAEGEWQDAHIRSGPGGTTGPARFNPFVERLRLLGTALGPLQTVWRRVTGNEEANLLGSPREDDLPWMSLVGVVANGDGKRLAGRPGTAPHQRIAVGGGTDGPVTVTRGGYLYAFANDAWGFYGNNRGSVRLTVTRLA
ncbi:DUF2235 domain-containing protein [Streptomyces sp. CRN 30]|uniref:DUF2235 domain-containing protein n=1 Tax=Streptomyces sp. CRN 30 TaxID=3075613 RepID=UPI002A80EF6E|nr:DUF2235 domain-containing protein [Streptomyces sp. CRN 30]